MDHGANVETGKDCGPESKKDFLGSNQRSSEKKCGKKRKERASKKRLMDVSEERGVCQCHEK